MREARLDAVKDWLRRKSVDSAVPTYRDSQKYAILSHIASAAKVWKLAPGDYLEFGLYTGTSFLAAYELFGVQHQFDTHFYGFDSFEGLPRVEGAETTYRHFEEGQYTCSRSEFEEILKEANVDMERVTLIEGFYMESLRRRETRALPIRRAAVAWIDCDLYESTVPVLEFLTPHLSSTSFLVFDDWFSFGADPQAGEMRATEEWLKRNSHIRLVEYRKFGKSGIVFLVQDCT